MEPKPSPVGWKRPGNAEMTEAEVLAAALLGIVRYGDTGQSKELDAWAAHVGQSNRNAEVDSIGRWKPQSWSFQVGVIPVRCFDWWAEVHKPKQYQWTSPMLDRIGAAMALWDGAGRWDGITNVQARSVVSLYRSSQLVLRVVWPACPAPCHCHRPHG